MTGQLAAETATVGTAMSHPCTVSPHTPFKHVLELLADRAVEAVAVVSATGVLVGEVSEVDLLRHRRRVNRRRDPGRATAGELMRSRVTIVPPSAPLARVERMLADRTQLYVVEDGRLVGVLTRRDVLDGLRRRDKEILADIEHRIGDAVRVSVHDGIVLITGRLSRRADIDPVLEMIDGIPGVIAVHNRVVGEELG
jgi:CBS domain-containing protein